MQRMDGLLKSFPVPKGRIAIGTLNLDSFSLVVWISLLILSITRLIVPSPPVCEN